MPIKKKSREKKSLKKRAVKRKVTKKKLIKKRPTNAKRAVTKQVKENVIGIATHYFPKVRAAVIKLKVPLAIGDTIKIKGHTTDFTQNITSMQIDRVPINSAKKGDEIGVLVISRVRRNDTVFKA